MKAGESSRLSERSTQALVIRSGIRDAMICALGMKLPHGPLKTWGEPCDARHVRRCGVMTAPARGRLAAFPCRGRVANTAKQDVTNRKPRRICAAACLRGYNHNSGAAVYYTNDRRREMPFDHTSFRVGDYEVSATFSGSHDPVILHNIQQILLSSFVGAEKHPSGDNIANATKPRYTIGGEQSHAP